jgi:hypothetical protein
MDCHGLLLRAVQTALAETPTIGALLMGSQTDRQLAIADLETKAWASATFSGHRHRLEIAYRAQGEDLHASSQIVAQVVQRLDDADLCLPGHALIDLRFVGAKTQTGATGDVSANLAFDAITLED